MIRVLFVEASSGGVVGGSLTGLYHLIRGLDRNRFAPAMVLYEPKAIEADLRALEVPVYHVHRRRISKEHALLKYDGYHRAKASSGVRVRCSAWADRRCAWRWKRCRPRAHLPRVIRREKPDVVHLGNGVRANFDGVLACWLTRTPCVCHVKGFEKYSARERWAGAAHRCAGVHDQGGGRALRAERRARPPHPRGVRRPRRSGVRSAARSPARCAPSWASPTALRASVSIGNIQEWKGQAVLVEAMARVVEAVPQARGLDHRRRASGWRGVSRTATSTHSRVALGSLPLHHRLPQRHR